MKTIDETYNQADHFKNCFQKIVKHSTKDKISVVIDNIDRVDPTDALEIIRVLKTFVDGKILKDNGIKKFVLIVPCDEHELSMHIKTHLHLDNSHEFLRKFFNISISIPKLVHEDIYNITKDELDDVNGFKFLNFQKRKLIWLVLLFREQRDRAQDK